MRRRGSGPRSWGEAVLWAALALALALLLTAEARDPAPEAPTAQEWAAQFAAQERYYEVIDRYGDIEGAVEAARIVFEDDVTTK